MEAILCKAFAAELRMECQDAVGPAGDHTWLSTAYECIQDRWVKCSLKARDHYGSDRIRAGTYLRTCIGSFIAHIIERDWLEETRPPGEARHLDRLKGD